MITKVATFDIHADVDYYHIEQYGEHQYLSHLEEAVTNPNSRAHASLYEFLLAIFIECDCRCGIMVGMDQKDSYVGDEVQFKRRQRHVQSRFCR